MNAYLHSVRKPLKACADHTRADHTRQRLVVWSAAVEGFVCAWASVVKVLSVGKLSVRAGKNRRGWPISFLFYYYKRNIEMSIYRHRFLMNNKAVR